MTYKLIALDLDGTLLNSGLKLSDGNGEALRSAVERGIQVVIATSRWYELALRTANRIGIETPIIASNGAIVKRPADGAELRHLYLDGELARDVVTLADDSGWEMFTTIGSTTYMQMRPGVIPDKLPAGLKVAERQSDHLGDAKPTSVLLFGDEAVREVEGRFMTKYSDRARFSLNRPVGLPHYVVLTNLEAEKSKGLELVCHELGVDPRDAISMGDSESDLGMLRFAGLGIAMGNSPDEVKRAALHIAPTNDNDGVAWAVRKFLL